MCSALILRGQIGNVAVSPIPADGHITVKGLVCPHEPNGIFADGHPVVGCHFQGASGAEAETALVERGEQIDDVKHIVPAAVVKIIDEMSAAFSLRKGHAKHTGLVVITLQKIGSQTGRGAAVSGVVGEGCGRRVVIVPPEVATADGIVAGLQVTARAGKAGKCVIVQTVAQGLAGGGYRVDVLTPKGFNLFFGHGRSHGGGHAVAVPVVF